MQKKTLQGQFPVQIHLVFLTTKEAALEPLQQDKSSHGTKTLNAMYFTNHEA